MGRGYAHTCGDKTWRRLEGTRPRLNIFDLRKESGVGRCPSVLSRCLGGGGVPARVVTTEADFAIAGWGKQRWQAVAWGEARLLCDNLVCSGGCVEVWRV